MEAKAWADEGERRDSLPQGKARRPLPPRCQSPLAKDLADRRIIPLAPGDASSLGKNIKNFTSLKNYFNQHIVIVEVKSGESKKEAWRRYLSAHPHSANADVKIFHYL